jgi:serine kinase of HPr protein (carbohydrate metabolism regulator)
MTIMSPVPPSIHATAIVLGEQGVLLRGPSGSGKTRLAAALIDVWQSDGAFASLVGDDRVRVTSVNGRLLARPHPVIAGKMEARGLGILEMAHEPAATIVLVIDLDNHVPERLPDRRERVVIIEGNALPVVRIEAGAELGDAVRLVRLALRFAARS